MPKFSLFQLFYIITYLYLYVINFICRFEGKVKETNERKMKQKFSHCMNKMNVEFYLLLNQLTVQM